MLNAQLHRLIIRVIFSMLVGDLGTARVGSKSPAREKGSKVQTF